MSGADLAFEKFEFFCKKLTYKPGWKLEVKKANVPGMPDYNGITLTIIFRVPSADKGGHPTEDLAFYYNWPAAYFHFVDKSDDRLNTYVFDLIIQKIRYVEEHELKEWLKFEGMRIYDPHPEREDFKPSGLSAYVTASGYGEFK